MAVFNGLAIKDELLNELLASVSSPDQLLGKGGLLKQLTARLVEKALQAEMTDHLGREPGQTKPPGATNGRNGYTSKIVSTDHGDVTIDVPRDRDGTFEPKIVMKRERRLAGFDERILALYARGMTVRDIQGHLQELCGVEVSPDLISRVIYTTNAIESINSTLRKLVYYRGHFPSDDAVFKLLYLALRNLEKRWDRSVWNWTKALGQFAVFFPDRLPSH
jgi:putative transposase